ncbi:hypothetical protein [Desulfococcus sp.]|uniref:hypothetical protein n=1 Tax=Desulfococcus sp. TaxID=2025834 RepID=UPI00359398C7
MEETIEKRINIERSEEIARQRVWIVAAGCPFCLSMIEDGMEALEKEEKITTMDITAFVEKSMV